MTIPSITKKDVEKAKKITLFDDTYPLDSNIFARKEGSTWYLDFTSKSTKQTHQRTTADEVMKIFNNAMNAYDLLKNNYNVKLYGRLERNYKDNVKPFKYIKGSKGKRVISN